MPGAIRADNRGEVVERLRILEKAVGNLGDSLEKRDGGIEADLSELQAELKAIKLFLARNVPDFKKEFPAIRQKLK